MKKDDVEVVEPIEQKITDVRKMEDIAIELVKNTSNFFVENIPLVVNLIEKGKKIKAIFDPEDDDDGYDND